MNAGIQYSIVVFVFLLQPLFANAEDPSGILIFQRDIKPIFAENCLSCHGESQQTLGLRLDQKAGALAGGLSGPALVPGDSGESLLFQMISGMSDIKMPPEGDPLTEEEIALIKTWIDQGAHWEDETAGGEVINVREHWAYQPISHPDIPKVNHADWISSPIDNYVMRKLEEEDVEPSPEAPRETLIRRLHLDITGIPPTPKEVQEFVNSDDPNAYEKLVDTLLASPHYGERWGRHWLDLARYADSDGYEKDTVRPYAWRYRDWVIDALNRDLPFDRFTIEQIAGDLLPKPSIEQLTATGFHRMTLTNKEGGVDQEEFRINAVKDRVSTTGTVWLGLTVACAECHTHKFDPITQKEFYQFYSFFNTADEKDIKAPFPDELARYEGENEKFEKVHNTLLASAEAYRQVQMKDKFEAWTKSVKRDGVNWQPLHPVAVTSPYKTAFEIAEDGIVEPTGINPSDDMYSILVNTNMDDITALRLEVYSPDEGNKGTSRASHGNFVLSEFKVYSVEYSEDGNLYQVPLTRARSDYAQPQYDAKYTIDGKANTGWAIGGQEKLSHSIVFDITDVVKLSGDVTLKIQLDHNYGSRHNTGMFRLFATNDKTPGFDGIPYEISKALDKKKSKRSDAETEALMAFYERKDPVLVSLKQTLAKHNETKPPYPKSYIMGFTQPAFTRKSYLHERGDFLRKADEVQPGVMQILHPLQVERQQPTRLDLANWLVSPDNPLTARVAVNRVWQHLFGEGIVRTPDDFGVRGDKPTHPELLDWLAHHYMRIGWSQKELIKFIVMSSTYKQSSNGRPDLKSRDPLNHWLARQNRFRLTGESVRDAALTASGLLSEKIGGPSIRPPMPSDLAALGYANSVKWKNSEGEDRYRRGLYIFFQRTVPYPMLVTFDAPEGTVTCTQRERSNTPLQALTILNDPVFFECAQYLGKRLADYETESLDEKLRQAYLLTLSREPSAKEMKILKEVYQAFQTKYENNTALAADITQGCEISADKCIETAVWIAIGRTLLNVEEFFTRQ